MNREAIAAVGEISTIFARGVVGLEAPNENAGFGRVAEWNPTVSRPDMRGPSSPLPVFLTAGARRACLLTALALGCAAPALAQSPQHEAAIREARARSNGAIQRQDVPAIVAELDVQFQLTAGSGRFIRGPEGMADAFAEQFSRFPDALYVRTIESVDVAATEDLAFETGSWVGTWTAPEGPVRVGGRYSASWIHSSGEWRIRSELFVTLFCEGSGCS